MTRHKRPKERSETQLEPEDGTTLNKKAKSEHYGYTYYADRDVVENYNLDRYGYSFGKYLLAYETGEFMDLISSKGTVLDVGIGTGKLFLSLLERGQRVKGVDASPEMVSFVRERCSEDLPSEDLLVADAQNLPFQDGSFDSVVSSRVLMHLMDWRKGIAEYCRLAKSEVVIDFPTYSGFTALVPAANSVKRLFSSNPRPYSVFSVKSVAREFEKNGFEPVEIKRFFFLPVFAHRFINNVNLSVRLEKAFKKLYLTDRFGGPVLIKARRTREQTP